MNQVQLIVRNDTDTSYSIAGISFGLRQETDVTVTRPTADTIVQVSTDLEGVSVRVVGEVPTPEETMLADALKRVEALEGELATANSNLEMAAAEIKVTKDQLADSRVENAALEREVDLGTQRLDSANAEIQALKDQLAAVTPPAEPSAASTKKAKKAVEETK